MPPAIAVEHLWNATRTLHSLADEHPELPRAVSRTILAAAQELLEYLHAYAR